MSDDEESSEEEVVIKLDLVEYNYLRAEKNKFKVIVDQWVRLFKVDNKRSPKDQDTESIAVQLQDYKDAEKNYLDFKIKMYQAQLLPFNAFELLDDLGQSARPPSATQKSNIERKATVLLGKNMT